MFASDITLGLQTYALSTQRPTSSVRRDNAQPLDEPVSLSIAHEKSNNGRVSSVVAFDSSVVLACGTDCSTTAPVTDSIKLHTKLVYNPESGRTTPGVEIERLRQQMLVFVADETLWARFINQES